ncbi:MAG TPA: hypothetical protein VK915_04710 [Gaiellaceae bacterium]|nr:hypothetical protein [Gaiellaceae bacterium]
MSTQERGRALPRLTPLPRFEDLPNAADGFDRVKVQEALDAFRRHVTSLHREADVQEEGLPPPILPPAPAPQEQWNLWDLERRARDESTRDPDRYEEWSYLFVHLRQFAARDGSLPTEFDGLVRESFGDLLEHAG